MTRPLIALIFIPIVVAAISCTAVRERNDLTEIAFLRGPSAIEAIRMIDSLSSDGNSGFGTVISDEPLALRRDLMEGKADFAILPTTMAALLYNKGVDYRIAAVPVWGSLYVCGTDTSLQSITGLSGKTVHVMARGMTPDILVRRLLRRNGIDPDRDVSLDYRFPTHTDLANAAIAGRTELCVLSEPYISQAVNANPRLKVLLDLGEIWRETEGAPLPETAFLCKGSLAASAITAAVVNALRRSAEWVKEQPDSAAALAVRFGINPDTAAVRSSIGRSGFKVVDAAAAEDDIKEYLRIITEESPEATGGKIPDEKFFVR